MPENQLAARDENSLAVLIERPEYKNRFGDVLGQRAPQFLSSLLSLSMTSMRDVEPKSIIAAAMTAASLDLPINQNLGFAYIIAYKDNNQGGKKFAQFQMGYKGFVQLAQRTRQYRFINACRVFKGELVKYDKLTGELIIAEDKKESDEVVGYASFFSLTSGFEHSLYMTVEQVDKHARLYSQAYNKGWKSMWKDNFDAMALKTVLKLNLSKWAPLSIQMEKGMFEDQAVKVDVDASARHIDNLEPMASPQIEDLKSANNEPTGSAPTSGEQPPAGESPKEEKKGRGRPPKKESLKVEPPSQLASAPAEKVAIAAVVGASDDSAVLRFTKKLNDAGFMLIEFLVFAVWCKWLDAPDGYFTMEGDERIPGDPADLEGLVIPDDKVETFLEPDNWELIVDHLKKRKS